MSTPWLIMLVAKTASGVSPGGSPGVSSFSRISATLSVGVFPVRSATSSGLNPRAWSSKFTWLRTSVFIEESSKVFLKYVSDVEGVSQVMQYHVKGSILFGNRDFIYCKTGYLLKNGHYLIINHSVPTEEAKTKGSIRGNLEEIILLTPDGEKKTNVFNAQKVDMKGNIPPSVLKTLMKKRLDEYVSFRSYNAKS